MVKESSKETSVIIVSYNSKKYLEKCLNSVFDYLPQAEIIVVDNASTDDSVIYLKKLQKQSKIKLILLDDNLGFGAANNRGVAVAQGDYLLFLNSDTLLQNDPLSKGINFLKENQETAVYSCQLRNPDGSIQPSGGNFPNFKNILAWQFFVDDLPIISNIFPSFHPKQNQYHKPQYLDWLTGAFMLVPKKYFDLINGFDEKIFMYTEELELCFRLSKKGKKCFFDPENQIIHYGGGSGGSYLAITMEIKNLIYFFQKHKSKQQLFLLKSILICGCLLRWFIFGIIKGNGQSRKAYIDAIKSIA
jgi:GT2 family glycosyltransferase